MASTDPNDAGPLLQQGRDLMAVRPATAIAYIERALQLDPAHDHAVEALASLAEGYLALKRFRECGFLLESCVELEPQHLDHHVRLCAFRLTRAHYRKAAEGLRRYLDAGGSGGHLERELTERQHPRSVVRALRALCEILQRVPLADLPPFKNMAEILAFEEKLGTGGRPELSADVGRLPGVSGESSEKLRRAGIATIAQLAATSVSDLVALGFPPSEAESLVDVASSEVYLVNSQTGRPPEPG
jgi:tetratricopeptide (TPR) repeat protein